jgi:sugar (pentulose or hexulose) kinase
MPLYLGIAGSAQALSAVVIEIGPHRRRIVFQRAINFDRDLPEYGTVGGLLPGDDHESRSVVIADALDRLLGRLAAAAEIDVDDLRGIGGASTDDAAELRGLITSLPPSLQPSRPFAPQVRQLAADGPPVNDLAESRGHLAAYWQRRFSLPPAPLAEWTSDTSARTVGLGVVRPGVIGIDLGTSDVMLTGTPQPATLHFRNGAVAREWIRLQYGLNANAVVAILERSRGNDGYIMLPWLEPETTPRVTHAGIRRFAFDRFDAARNVRALIEGQMMAMANHAADLTSDPIETVIATGAGSADYALLQVMANVFGADVYRFEPASPVALGAALRAYYRDRTDAGGPMSWADTVKPFTDPHPGHRVAPNPRHVATYAALRSEYAILERLHGCRRPIC